MQRQGSRLRKANTPHMEAAAIAPHIAHDSRPGDTLATQIRCPAPSDPVASQMCSACTVSIRQLLVREGGLGCVQMGTSVNGASLRRRNRFLCDIRMKRIT